MTVKLIDYCGSFAENKDIARDIRNDIIKPAIERGEKKIIIDFINIDSSTQSFVHALLSAPFRQLGEDALEIFEFHNCLKNVQSLIATVVNYTLE